MTMTRRFYHLPMAVNPFVVNIGGDPTFWRKVSFFSLFHDCKDFGEQFNIKTRIKSSE